MPHALVVLAACYTLPEDLLDRHALGDWGELNADDSQRNERAIRDGSRIFSEYHLEEGWTLWVITEAEDEQGIRSHTTVLLPEEYPDIPFTMADIRREMAYEERLGARSLPTDLSGAYGLFQPRCQ
ncbi:MAG: hypothetical protein PHI29_10850 [Gallionella sp.]|nr:hypothetical protein [Gallionella sp.]